MIENPESLDQKKSAPFATYASISLIIENFLKKSYEAFFTKQNLLSFPDEETSFS